MLKKVVYIFILTVFIGGLSYGQRKPQPQNYRKFDQRMFHFGFMLGGNTTDFSTYYKANLHEFPNLYSIENKSQPGFQLGLIGTMKLGSPLIRLKFIPSISFQERLLIYKYFPANPGDDFDIKEERVGSTNLDFPLLFKFRTQRYNNFAAYVITGAQYTLDLQSKQNAAQKWGDPFLKIKRDDFQGQIGAGVDFFFTFFKMSLEVKFSHGFVNALYPDDTRLSDPINKLYNRVWHFSITFEG